MVAKLDKIPKDTEMLSAFGGIDRNLLIGENYFSEMKNMTGDFYPLAGVRAPRGSASLPEGVVAMQICNTYLTREEIQNGKLNEDVFALVQKNDEGEAILSLYKEGVYDGTGVAIGKNPDSTVLIPHAGYVYAFPQGYREACYTGGESGSLSNVTVTRRVAAQSASQQNVNARFEMRPCDSEGIADGGAVANASITKVYDTAQSDVTRDNGDLVLVKASGMGVNSWGTTVRVDSYGKVTKKYYGTAETIEIDSGEKFVLTGHGFWGDWLLNNATEGRYVSVDESTMKVSIFETNEDAVVYEKPDSPFNGLKWYDSKTGSKYVYSTARSEWVAYVSNYILFSFSSGGMGSVSRDVLDVLHNGSVRLDPNSKLECLEPFFGYKDGDAIEIKGFSEEQDGSYIIEKYISPTKIVLAGTIDDIKVKNLDEIDNDSYDKAVTVSRAFPRMDFVIECNNRLWGCCFGIDEKGKVINEIYASALGDPTNWRRYQGISTDSWTATVGADGPFTGAIQYGGYPLFFKENTIIRVYGSTPSSFQIASYNYRGVQKGSHRSLAICDEVLYYLSGDGVMAYSGSVPQKVSEALGSEAYHGGVAGACGSKYYLSCLDSSDNVHLFVFNARYGFWHREDDLRADQFMRHKETLYMLTGGKVITASGGTETVEFEAVTGEWGLSNPYRKHFNNFIIRALIPFDGTLTVYISYDGGPWRTVGTYSGDGMTKIQARITDHSCDNVRLKFEGEGPVKIVSVYREISNGGKNVY